MLPFLQYINHPEHEWVCCIGVPYATHIWQVGDASELNGAFKIALTIAKCVYLHHRSSSHFIPTDIVPLINQAWKASFDRKEWVQKAIAAHGWNPLNYCLLDHPGVKKAPTDVVDLTIYNNDDSAKLIALPAQPNAAGGLGSYYIDKLIEEEKKNEW